MNGESRDCDACAAIPVNKALALSDLNLDSANPNADLTPNSPNLAAG